MPVSRIYTAQKNQLKFGKSIRNNYEQGIGTMYLPI